MLETFLPANGMDDFLHDDDDDDDDGLQFEIRLRLLVHVHNLVMGREPWSCG